jgi:hypothetical protein
MLEFDFTVNKSFIERCRQITIPQRFRISLDGSIPVRINCPNGTPLKGRIYTSHNPYEYSQIYINKTPEIDPLGNYEHGQRLIIKISENFDYIEIKEG